MAGLANHRLVIRFLDRLLNNGLNRRANRAVTNDLAKGAERSELLAGVQVGPAMVLNLANPGNFVMVVKDFGRKEVDFTREQHPHHQGMHPILVPIFSPPSQLDGSALYRLGFKLSS